ncbi:MAG: MlaE family lipid ABC transporter permease subunit [Spirochaetota bacterium]
MDSLSGVTSDILFRSELQHNTLHFYFQGSLDSKTTGKAWRLAFASLSENAGHNLVINCKNLLYCDGSGIGLLFQLKQSSKKDKRTCEFLFLKEQYSQLLQQFPEEGWLDAKISAPVRYNRIEQIGSKTQSITKNLKDSIGFLGELVYIAGRLLPSPQVIRWKDFWRIAENAGVNAFPIIALIGFLLGLIMSFQSAIPMQRFGAEIFVANLVSISLFRELGPLMTGVILAGRTASSFAAELGTMKINEEIDAFTTMGLKPTQFLVIPRLLAALFVTPFLVIFFNLFGLMGSALVIMSFDYPLVTFVNQVVRATDYGDLLTGLFKAMVFGMLVAGIGCFQGLKTGTGSSAVGESTTKSVVSGIIIIAITDGIFSVMFFYLGI